MTTHHRTSSIVEQLILANLILVRGHKLYATIVIITDVISINVILTTVLMAIDHMAADTNTCTDAAMDFIRSNDIMIAPQVDPRGIGILLSCANIMLDDVVYTGFLHLYTLIALGIHKVERNIIIVRLVGAGRRVFTISPLLTRCADINGFAIFATRAELEIIDAAFNKTGKGDFAIANEITQTKAFPTCVLKMHTANFNPGRT